MKTTAYCWANGVIEFTDGKPPRDSIWICSGPSRQVRALMAVVARHGHKKGDLLVPGVPEAADEDAAVNALEAFIDWVSGRTNPAIIFNRPGK